MNVVKAPKVLAMLVSMICGKAAIITLLSKAFGLPTSNAIQTGLLNSQGIHIYTHTYIQNIHRVHAYSAYIHNINTYEHTYIMLRGYMRNTSIHTVHTFITYIHTFITYIHTYIHT